MTTACGRRSLRPNGVGEAMMASLTETGRTRSTPWVFGRALYNVKSVFLIAQSGRLARVIKFDSGMTYGAAVIALCPGFQVSRNFQDWEVSEDVELLQLLATIRLNKSPNKLLWDLKKNGKFSVNSFFYYLGGYKEIGPIAFPTKMVWKSKVLLCISFFAWEAVKEHIQTIDNLMKRGKIMVNRCFLCKADRFWML